MSPEEVSIRQEPTAGDLVERLVRFEGAPQEFLRYLLAVQCRLASAAAGVILRAGQNGDLQIIAIYPPPERAGTPPAWVAQAGEAAGGVLANGKSAIVPVYGAEDMYGAPPKQHLILLPIRYTGRSDVRGVNAFLLRQSEAAALQASRERLELSNSLLSLYEMRLMLQRRDADMVRLRNALEVASAANQHDRFRAAAMEVCNEFAARWGCHRVSLGFLRGRGIKLTAISHTENFARKMQLVQDLEEAMEECLDQDVEVIHPAPTEATYVSRASARLSERQGPSAVCSFPLRRGEDVVAVLTAERSKDQPFDDDTVESMRLTTDLVTARLVGLHEQDRWFGAKAARSVRKGAAAFVGPKHTWAKLLAIGIAAVIAFMIFAKGEYTVKAPFVLASQQRRVVSAAFDGILESVEVKLGEKVTKGQLLGKLEATELELALISAESEVLAYTKEADTYMREEDFARADMARAQARKAQSQADILADRKARASMRAPMDGYVVVGDLEREIGAPVKKGQVLWEIAPVRQLRAELSVDEKDVHHLRGTPTGELATAGEPAQHVGFEIENISPIAESEEGKNTFKVRVRLTDPPFWMIPGMSGVAHVSIGPRRYAWIWTHRVINWIRLKLWL